MTADVKPIAKLLPRMRPETAQVSRVAFDARFRPWLCALVGREDLNMLRRPPPDDAEVLDIEAGNGRLAVALDPAAWPALRMALSLPLQADACAVASVLLAPWFSRFAQTLPSPRVAGHVRQHADATLDASAVVATPASRVTLLRADENVLRTVRRALAAVPSNATRSLAALRLQPRLVLDRRSMPEATLRSLANGDIVLLDTPPRSPRLLQLIFGKGTTMQSDATIDENTGQPVVTGEPSIQEEDTGPDHGASLDQLQVPVSFEIDTARVTLAELANIGPGYVIELERPLHADMVRLVCHGQTVGHGQLVAVGERMGIRIVRMALAQDAGGDK